MTTKLLPEEILTVVLKKIDRPEISLKNNIFHKSFYELRKDSDFSSILKAFRFAGSPIAPFSEVLDDAFFNLQYGSKLKRFNPDLITYKITEDFNKYYNEKILPKLQPADSDLLDKLAKRLLSLIKD